MGNLSSIIKKEALHIVRDKRTMLITLVMPLVLLLLFGFAISTEVNNVRVAAVVDRHTDVTRDILMRIDANEYLSFKGLTSAEKVESQLRCGEIDAALMLREDDGAVKSQIIVDAANPTFGQSAASYITGVLTEGMKSPVITRTLYNPMMKSSYNFVPGILGMIFILICAIMTSVSIVREKESGTMNLLLVSPIRPASIIIGKLIPYFILSCIILAIMLLMSYTLLGLPFSSTVFSVVAVSLLYIILSLSVGLFVSTLVSSQVAALLVSAMMFMTPVIMLSGMMFPIDNMPDVLQWFSCIIPARWYIAAMRKLMVQQLGIFDVSMEIVILVLMTVVLLTVSVIKLNASNKR